MWSDPIETDDGKFPDNNDNDFVPNSKRNCSYNFGLIIFIIF